MFLNMHTCETENSAWFMQVWQQQAARQCFGVPLEALQWVVIEGQDDKSIRLPQVLVVLGHALAYPKGE